MTFINFSRKCVIFVRNPVSGQEILCLKELRKLRYGRLRHLQREMQKLEDLERFIDSCSGTDSHHSQ